MNIVKSKFSNKSWVVNSNRKRISDKLFVGKTFKVGPFFVVEHSEGTIIYLNDCEEKVGDFSATDCYKKNVIFDGYYYFKTEQGPLIYNDEGRLVSEDILLIDKVRGTEELIPAFSVKAKHWGYIDCNLNWKIQPIYIQAGEFNGNGLAIVRFKGEEKIGVIDKNHKILFAPKKFWDAYFITEDMLVVRELTSKSGRVCSQIKKGLMNLLGQIILPTDYLDIIPEGNVFLVETLEGWGVVDTLGNIVHPCKYTKEELLALV